MDLKYNGLQIKGDKKMKKKTMITMVVGVLIVCIGFLCIRGYQLSQVEALEMIEQDLCELASESIVEITIEGDTVQSFVKKGTAWENIKHPMVAYNQGLIQNIAYQMGNLQSYKLVKNVQDPTTYGITESSKKIIVKNTEGTSNTYWLGHSVPEENATFIWLEERDKLALVLDIELASVMVPTGEMIEKVVQVPQLQDIQKVELKEKGVTTLLLTKDETWMMHAPFSTKHIVDTEKVETYLQVLENIDMKRLVEDEPKDLVQYGLETPELQLVINDEIIFNFGTKVGNNLYFKMNQEDEVYEIKSGIESELRSIQPFEWISKTIYTPDRKQLSYVEVQHIEEVYRLQLKEAEQVPSLNGQVIEPNVKEEMLKQLEDLKLAKHLTNAKFEETNPRPAELTIRFGYLDGEVITIEFVPYDPSFDLVRREGMIEFATEKKSLVNLVDYLKMHTESK